MGFWDLFNHKEHQIRIYEESNHFGASAQEAQFEVTIQTDGIILIILSLKDFESYLETDKR